METKIDLNKPNCYYTEENHSYHSLSDDKLWAGVSSVSGLAKNKESSNALMQWAANMCSAYTDEKWDVKKTVSEKEKKEILENARYAYKNYSKEAMNVGSDIHKKLENFINGKIEGKPVDMVCTENAFIQNALDKFREKTKDWIWLASEMLVGDDEHEVAGRLDALAAIRGRIYVIDFKVSTVIDPTYYIQTAGYQMCLESMGAQIKGRIIIRIPKTEKRKIWDSKLRKASMVNNELEIYLVKTNYDFDKEVFLNLRNVSRWINAAK